MFGTKIIKFDNDTYAFDQTMVRAFLILGRERALLFDTGVEKADLTEMIKEITDLPVELCLSHSDPDHTANVGEFSSLYIHEAESERFRAMGKSCSAGKISLIEIKENFEFDLGGRILRVIHCPGHTPGSIALLEEGKRLFSGDTVSLGPVYMFGEGRDDAAYMKTLGKLKKLYESGAFSTVYPCHNTCPAEGRITDELISCMEGIKAGTLPGVPAPMQDTDGRRVLEYCEGECGIYHI